MTWQAIIGDMPRTICNAHQLGIASRASDSEPSQFNMADLSQYSHMLGTLDLSGRNIAELPSDFYQLCPHLEELNLRGVGISVLPEGVKNCPKMAHLDISSNNIRELPADFDSCAKSLQSLNLADNPLYAIPAVIYQCQHLVSLDVTNTGLTSLPEDVGSLGKLETLLLGNNALETLPGALSKLVALKELDVSGVAWIEGKETQKTFVSKDAFDAYCRTNHVVATLSKKVLYVAEVPAQLYCSIHTMLGGIDFIFNFNG